MPSGAASSAARRRLVLYELSRRLPDTARIRMSVLLPHEGQVGLQGDLVAEVVATALVRRVPGDAELVAVDRGLEREPEALAAERVDARRRSEAALQLDRLRDALDGQLARAGDGAAV